MLCPGDETINLKCWKDLAYKKMRQKKKNLYVGRSGKNQKGEGVRSGQHPDS